MANEKKPSIYHDRGTIGSAKELDEYGVWVKSEPQVLSTEEAEKGADDFPLDGLEDLPDFSTDLGASLEDSPDSPAEAESAESIDDSGSALGDADYSIPEDDFNLDDFDLGAIHGDMDGTGDDGSSSGDSAADFSIPGGEDLADFSIDDGETLGEQDPSLGEEPEDLDLSLPEEDAGPELSLAVEDFDNSLSAGEAVPAEESAAGAEEEAAGGAEGTGEPESDEGFNEISLEDLLGGVADEVPGGAESEEFPAGDLADEEPGEDSPGPAEASRGASSGADMSTQLLMKIANELSSIRTELGALKQEFATIRGSADHAEPRGFFDDSGDDDKIALTGDELNNILNTADFTEETGLDATGEDLSPDFSEGDHLGTEGGGDGSPEAADEPLAEIDLDSGLADLTVPADEVPGIELDGEFDLSAELEPPVEAGGLDEAAAPGEAALLDASNLLDEVDLPGEEGLPALAGEAETEPDSGADPDSFEMIGELGGEELSLVDLAEVDLPDDLSAGEFSTQDGEHGEIPGETGEDAEPLAGGVEITLEDLAEAPPELSDDSAPDISFDALTEEESIALEGFDEDALDLTGAVIDEPNLGAEIQENPLLEPAAADIAVLEDPLAETEELVPEEEAVLEAEVIEEPSLEILDEPGPADFSLEDLAISGEPEDIAAEVETPLEPALDDIEDEAEISRAEESAAEIPAVRGNIARGEDLDQIIPEGFMVEETDDEGETGFGGAGLDTLDMGISLDEIPEDILPEEDEPVPIAAEAVEEPGVSTLPGNFKQELKQVLSYMDQLLESLPEEKIEEFAKSEYFDTYKKLFKELGLV
jgi:hypothetical protein